MRDKVFFDTNIIVYATFNDGNDKTSKARMAIKEFPPIVSTQVLNELSSVFFRKHGFSSLQIHEIIDTVCDVSTVCPITVDTIHSAIDISDRYGFSYYDSLILATALENNCNKVYSEDMKDGQNIEGKIEIVNPFRMPE